MNGNDLNNGDDKQHSEDEGTGMINDQTSPSCVGNSIEESRFDEMDAQIRSNETIDLRPDFMPILILFLTI